MNIYYNLEAINRIKCRELLYKLFLDQAEPARRRLSIAKPEFFWEGERNNFVLGGKMNTFADAINQLSPAQAKAYLAHLHLENIAYFETVPHGDASFVPNLLYSYEFSPGVGKQWVVVFSQLHCCGGKQYVFRIFLPYAVFEE